MPDATLPVGLFAGLTAEQLVIQLAAAQQAYLQLMLGQKGVSYSYSQGDGSKSVTYVATSPAQVSMLIRQLQAALGIIPQARRPMRPLYTR